MALKESSHKFIDPVRYFKENDPYYWEVDNIPLKQLQENCLWLKDQIEIILGESGLGRSSFTELQPYTTGDNNIVKVRKGRFTARINDAYSLTPLQKIEKLTTSSFDISKFTINPSGLTPNELINKLSDVISESSYNLNGLIERTLSWPTSKNVADSNVVGFEAYDQFNTSPLPKFVTQDLGKWPLLQNLPFLNEFLQRDDPATLQQMSIEFCRQFRGVARTAIVDVPEDLEIEIPDFDVNDFGYYNESGQFILFENPSVRIDLLFIYSKPVDSDVTTIASFGGNNTARIITKPTLGLVRGAGVLLSKNTNIDGVESVNSLDGEGNSQILAQIADSNIPTNGFQDLNVHGSFPSPDDLMNLAPLISEKLQQNDPRLIGQTILPVAYVVVRNNQLLSAEGVPVINTVDVIDIRPFFRTTELTYNERAGIAAAVPSPSLANPVATKFVVEENIKNIKTYSDETFEKKGKFFTHPKIIAAGYILGGTTYGPEGQLIQENSIHLTTLASSLPALPQWDKASRLGQGSPTQFFDWFDVTRAIENIGNIPKYLDRNRSVLSMITFKKKIIVTNVNQRFPGCVDYFVKLNYFNCAPITGNGAHGHFDYDEGIVNQVVDHSVNGLYAIKGPIKSNGDIEFTIMCVASIMGFKSFNNGGLPINADRLRRFFVLTNFPTFSQSDSSIFSELDQINPINMSLYPSVSFEVVGVNNARLKYNWVDDQNNPINTIEAFGDLSEFADNALFPD